MVKVTAAGQPELRRAALDAGAGSRSKRQRVEDGRTVCEAKVKRIIILVSKRECRSPASYLGGYTHGLPWITILRA